MTSPRTYEEIQEEIGEIIRSCVPLHGEGSVTCCNICYPKIQKLAKERDSL